MTEPPRSAPKPCPRCYAPMRPTADGFACAKHGAPPPTPAYRPRLHVKAAQPAAKRTTSRASTAKPKAEPRVRQRVRFPSDLKTYPLPPAADGRANAVTSVDSPTTARSRLTPALLERARGMAENGLTPWQIAGAIWEEAGYSSRDACKGSLYRALRKARVVEHA